MDERVKMQAAEIRRSTTLSGFKGEGLEKAVWLAFLNGFTQPDISVTETDA